MKKVYAVSLVIAVCFVFVGLTFADQTKDDISAHKGCTYCGMDRGSYHFSPE